MSLIFWILTKNLRYVMNGKNWSITSTDVIGFYTLYIESGSTRPLTKRRLRYESK